MKTDTIAAIATAMSPSGIGIIRISGEDAIEITDKIYRSKNNKKKISECKSHTIHYGYIYDGDEKIDEVMVVVMRAPATYTREDTIEIDCHGGVFVMKRILETVIKNGARPAEPGEYTKRAFLNGRIDLSQAESVIDVINSKNEFALKSSLSQLNGSVLKNVKSIREVLLHEIAFIESALDDPEHISLDGYPQKLESIVNKECDEIQALLNSSDNGRILKEGINTVIVGKPNAGKSSLLNAILKEDRAIVTEYEGTTRDTIEEFVNIEGIPLKLIDTAGIRNAKDEVEKIGIAKSREIAKEADLIIAIFDSTKELSPEDLEILNLIKGKKSIVILNKIDLNAILSENDDRFTNVSDNILKLSALNGEGLEKLYKTISKMFSLNEINLDNEIVITNLRHKNLISKALINVKKSEEAIEQNMPVDIIAIFIKDILEDLGNITGDIVTDDIINEIFSKFCLGK